MTNSERNLAESICKVHGKTLVDENGGLTLSGHQFAERYFKKWQDATSYNALCHWLLCAGYSESGEFQYILSNYKQ